MLFQTAFVSCIFLYVWIVWEFDSIFLEIKTLLKQGSD